MDSSSDSRILVGDDAIEHSLVSEFWELTKPRLSLLTIITAIVGYLVALPEKNLVILFSLIFGTSLAAGGAAALNMWLERETDKLMVRTRTRPLPAGVITPGAALAFGLALCVIGNGVLWVGVNGLAAFLAFLTQVTYLIAYTPLKRHTHWCTEVGAIPGAIPPLIGWAAAEGSIGALGWILFAILFAWQIPHFMAIAWNCRDDYANAGLPMLTVVEPSGKAAALESLLFTIILVIASILPTILGYTTLFFGIVAGLTGFWFLWCAILFTRTANRNHTARKLFIASIIYLPVVLIALVIDRWFLT